MNTPSVSVIIPVYNAERFFERCVRSLFEQTLEQLEYIFVNDATPDHSMEMLERVLNDYPARRPQVRIFEHPTNRGSGAARDTGMRAATGEYVIHCDSDDWIEPEMYGTMYRTAIRENADIVCCDFWAELPECSVLNQYEADAGIEPSGMLHRQQLTTGNCSLWNKLIRRELYVKNKIYPFEGINMWEDLGLTIRLRFLSKKTFILRAVLYHYNKQNESSITSSMAAVKSKTDQQILCASHIERFFEEQSASEEYKLLINSIKFLSKSIYLLKKPMRDIPLWKSIYPETHASIGDFRNITFCRRCEFWLTANGMTKIAVLLADTETATRAFLKQLLPQLKLKRSLLFQNKK